MSRFLDVYKRQPFSYPGHWRTQPVVEYPDCIGRIPNYEYPRQQLLPEEERHAGDEECADELGNAADVCMDRLLGAGRRRILLGLRLADRGIPIHLYVYSVQPCPYQCTVGVSARQEAA